MQFSHHDNIMYPHTSSVSTYGTVLSVYGQYIDMGTSTTSVYCMGARREVNDLCGCCDVVVARIHS